MANAPRNARPSAEVQEDIIEGTEYAIVQVASKANDLDAGLAVALSEAEINQQVATAKRFPRSFAAVIDRITQLATLDIATATECTYALPRGRDDQSGKAKVIEGPSIRFAELVVAMWGNARISARVVATDRKEKFIEAEGIYHDLETNVATASRIRRRISGRDGRLYNDDMIVVTGNAAASIALRNAILRGIPKPIWGRAYAKARDVVRGDMKSLGARRVDILAAFKENLGIGPRQVFGILGVKGEEDIGLDEIVVAAGFYTALKNNEVTVDDLLGQIAQPVGQGGAKTLSGAFGPAETATSPNGDQVDQQTGEVTEQGDKGGDKPKAPETPKSPPPSPPPASPPPSPPPAAAGPTGPVQGPAPSDTVYLLAGDSVGADGRRPTYSDGLPWSSVGPKGAKELTEYTEHAPLDPTDPRNQQGADEKDEGAGDQDGDEETAAAGDEKAAIRTSPEDRRDPAQDEADEPAATQGSEEPEAFADYRETIGELESWLTIKAAWNKLRVSEDYLGASDEAKQGIRVATFRAVDALIQAKRDPVKVEDDPMLFLLWVDVAEPGTVRPMFRKLIQSRAYGMLKDEQKDVIAETVDALEPAA